MRFTFFDAITEWKSTSPHPTFFLQTRGKMPLMKHSVAMKQRDCSGFDNGGTPFPEILKAL